MIDALTFFNKAEDLMDLAGLHYGEFRAADFPDYYEWSWGFVSDVCYTRRVVIDEEEDVYEYNEYTYGIPPYVRQLLDSMTEANGYYRCVEYKGKYYYFQCHT